MYELQGSPMHSDWEQGVKRKVKKREEQTLNKVNIRSATIHIHAIQRRQSASLCARRYPVENR